MGTPVGLSTPLLPVTGTFALPFTAYFTFLSSRVVYYRLKDQYYLGDNSSKETSQEAQQENKLYLASRCHQNFIENVPLGLILAAFAELNGGNRKGLAYALSALLAARLLHSELGLLTDKGMGHGRPIGYFSTMGILAGLAGYATYLTKSYWGF
ncbi:membrane-associated, eicosanoid/glutathione metabolism protein [Xylariaceae sp. FL0662B]|nr:membrane-associated, eicosanoid/glutathione metabolism protein [Xylariaceae sp. FL0662B]